MDQQADSDTAQLWASLSKAIEKETIPALSLNGVEVEQKYLLSDRLAGSYLSGFWPLTLFCLAILGASGQWADPVQCIRGLLFSLALAYMCRPLVRSAHGGTNLVLLAVSAPFLLFLVPVIQLLPASVAYHLTAQQLERDGKPLDYFLAETLQRQLESIFQPNPLLLLALGMALLCCSLLWLRSRFPWLEHRPGKPAGKLLAIFLLLSPWLLAAVATSSNPRVEEWKSQVGPQYRRLPVSRLQEGLSISFWRDLNSKFDRELAGELPTFSPETKVDEQVLARFQAFESEVLTALAQRGPASPEEATSCLLVMDSLASRPYLLSRPVEVVAALESEQFHGIRYQYSNYIWLQGVIPWLQAPARTVEDLEFASEILSRVQQDALSYLRDYDLTVYSVLVGDRRLPVPPKSVFRSDRSGRARYFITYHEPSEMRLLGVKIGPSPTEILARKTRLEVVETWMEIRPQFDGGLSHEQKLVFLEREESPESIDDYYQGWIAARAPGTEDRALRETTSLFARLLIHRAHHGSLPRELNEAGLDDTRWSLQSKDGTTVLVDQTLVEIQPKSPWSFE